MQVVPGHQERSGVNSGTYLHADAADPAADRKRAATGIDRRLEQREGTVISHLDENAFVMVDFGVNSSVVFAEKPIPRIVSESSGMLGRSDDIGYQDRAIDAPSLRLLPLEL